VSFNGKRVLSLESRRAPETAELIRRNGGEPFVAPSMREVPIEANQAAREFGERLLRGHFDMLIFLTGVGTRLLFRGLGDAFPASDALRKVTTVARGPKPAAALRELNVEPKLIAPEPNTWREILDLTDKRPERQVAIQEYGRPSIELQEGLRARGCDVTPVPVYQWQMPEDRGPLNEAARRLAAGEFDIVLFTTSQQIVHLMDGAAELGIAEAVKHGINRAVVASIGPTTSEMLREYGIEPRFEPSHPKLGVLVKEAAEQA
jgi:uroporphyrinogen-III synthase